MLGRTFTFSRIGMNCSKVEIEADIKRGLPSITISGLVSQEVRESKERVRPAIINSGFEFPLKRITINLSPAEIAKTGTHYDLAIAIAILKASQIIDEEDNYAYFGELNLGGEIKRIRGILPMVIEALNNNFEKVFIPKDNYREVSFLNRDNIFPVESINDIIEKINDEKFVFQRLDYVKEHQLTIDYSDIMGQKILIDAFTIAASGNHHMIIIGPPGSGKTMGASRLPTIMPNLTDEEIVEINKIYSIASLSNFDKWITTRPFRTPHNKSSSRAVIGGGEKILPGEISLSHNGILFLDEFLEFHSDTLQALRTVIERKEVFISLRNGNTYYPADFLLIAASNPCQCGFYDTINSNCSCGLKDIKKYRKKLRNPLTDRIDLQVKVDRINYQNLISGNKNKSSAELRGLVLKAREIQNKRYKNEKFKLNSEIPSEKISFYCQMESGSARIIENYMEDNLLTARACHKILKIARTISDIDESELIRKKDLEKAISFRFLDKEII